MRYPDFLQLISQLDPLTNLNMYANSALYLYIYVDRSDNKMMPLWLSQRVEFRKIRTRIVNEYNYDFFNYNGIKKEIFRC
jgi:hypothetical protein